MAKLLAFFKQLAIDTRLRDYTQDFAQAAAKVAESLRAHGMTALGERQDVTPEDAEKIVEAAY